MADRLVSSIYFGGGTPSLLEPTQIAKILDASRSAFTIEANAEVTLEANPTSVDESWFAGVLAAGVNRLSLGAQTMDRRGLRVLGRQHEAVDVARAFVAAKRAGFQNLSLDLIYGWPDQSLEVWNRDIEIFFELDAEHLSAYSLIIEPGTPMHEAVAREVLRPADDDLVADLYEHLLERMKTAGWSHYEISNWARTSDLISRHNRLYWRNGEYVAIGAGAHGRIGAIRVMNHLLPRTWITALEGGDDPVSNREEIDPQTSMGETMMLGLRLLDEGVDAGEFAARYGVSLEQQFGEQIRVLDEQGLVDWSVDRLRLTNRGMMLANEVCSRFV